MDKSKDTEANRFGELSEAMTLSSSEHATDLQPPTSRVADEVEPIHKQGAVVENTGASVQQYFPNDRSLNQTATILSEISNEPGTTVKDAAAVILEVHSIPTSHSPVTSEEELNNVLHQPEDGSPFSLSDVQINRGYSATDELRKSEAVPDKLNCQQVNVGSLQAKAPESADVSEQLKTENANRGIIDTAAPFESVKAAVSKFGGLVDWKTQKTQTSERHKLVQRKIEKLQEELPHYRRQSEAAQDDKSQVLTELNNTKRLIEELKLSLERAETEEVQAKQDSELAELRAKEMEQGIADEASVAAKSQLDVAKARHKAALSELKSVKEELEALKGEYTSLVDERGIAIKKAEESVVASKEIEKTVEDLTLELIAAKESLESAHATHLEAEEHRIGAALAKERDYLNWEKELKEAEEEVKRLSEQLSVAKDLKSKLDTASTLLLSLKVELAAYMESKLIQESEGTDEDMVTDDADQTKKMQTSNQAALTSSKKELEEVKANIVKAQDEVNCLRVAAASLKSELDKEKSVLVDTKQREGMVSVVASSLEAELNRTRQELEQVLAKEKEAREKMVELPKLLQQAAQEADQAKSVAQLAREELRKSKEEAEQAKAGANTMEVRLRAALKEIEASKTSERLAVAAVKALQESEQSLGFDDNDSPKGVTLPIEEYYILSKKAHEAEELARERVEAAMAKIEIAKESELRSLERLEEANKQMDERKESLKIVTERAEKAMEGKLGMEQDLRKWRAEHQQQRKASSSAQVAATDSAQVAAIPSIPRVSIDGSGRKSLKKEHLQPVSNHKMQMADYSPETVVPESKTRRKKSFFPRIVMFLARKKAQSLK